MVATGVSPPAAGAQGTVPHGVEVLVVRTVILCGGKGTRAYPHTAELPKPLLQVGDAPILRHLMDIFARQGFRDFVLAAGFRGDLIEQFAGDLPPEWVVDVAHTGEETGT